VSLTVTLTSGFAKSDGMTSNEASPLMIVNSPSLPQAAWEQEVID
jgi:hypothetical protein